jgi:hypothetical protein
MLVSSAPLSETTIAGRPRTAIKVSSSRATRRPGNDVSATKVRHSRVKSSTTARMRKRRPSVIASDRKSRLQRWFGPCGSAIGARVRPPTSHDNAVDTPAANKATDSLSNTNVGILKK